MATIRSQAARDAAPETTTERESVASATRADKLMSLLQQIVAHQTDERRARENDKGKKTRGKRTRETEERTRTIRSVEGNSRGETSTVFGQD